MTRVSTGLVEDALTDVVEENIAEVAQTLIKNTVENALREMNLEQKTIADIQPHISETESTETPQEKNKQSN